MLTSTTIIYRGAAMFETSVYVRFEYRLKERLSDKAQHP